MRHSTPGMLVLPMKSKLAYTLECPFGLAVMFIGFGVVVGLALMLPCVRMLSVNNMRPESGSTRRGIGSGLRHERKASIAFNAMGADMCAQLKASLRTAVPTGMEAFGLPDGGRVGRPPAGSRPGACDANRHGGPQMPAITHEHCVK